MSRAFVCLAFAVALASAPLQAALHTPTSVVVEAEGPAGARAFFTVFVVGGNDGSDGRPADTVSCTPPSGSLFSLGTTLVSCIGSEGSTGSFNVHVLDTTAPAISVPRDYTVVTSSPSGEAVAFSVTATDLVSGSVAFVCTPPSGSTFPVGTTNVNCTATDAAGNTASRGFNLTLAMSPPPPGNPDLVAEATGPDGARVTFNTGDSEDGDGRPGSGGCSPAPGSMFPLGETLVTCPSGNFILSVVDTTAPELVLPETLNATALSGAGAEVDFTATAFDLVDGAVGVSCTPPSGSTFPIGTTTVDCSASDSRNNTTTGSFDIVVISGTPVDLTVEATGPAGAVVTFSPALGTCVPSSGSTFALGATAVSCTAGSFTVTVVDTTDPILTVPDTIILEATGPSGAAATFTASATDLVDGVVTPVCVPPSGSTFAVGTNVVNCSATDAHGNASNGSFEVRVVDSTPPVLTLPADITAEATSPAGAVVTFTATAQDLVAGSVAVTCSPASGSMFPLGTTTVNCSATDGYENPAFGSFDVTVVDTTPPSITAVTVTPWSIWPPNWTLVGVTVTATVTDAADPAPLVQIYDITCDETIDGTDAVITGPLTADLRAARDPRQDGRVYTLHIEAVDASGNRSTATVVVTVPHDQRNKSSAPPGPKNKGGRP